MNDALDTPNDDVEGLVGDPGVGAVTVTVNDQRQFSYSVDPVQPDVNGNVSFYLQSSGSKQWSFVPNNPINIANPQNFSWTLNTPTQLNITDTSADRATVPTHQYTLMVQSQNGDTLEIDPTIRDRTT